MKAPTTQELIPFSCQDGNINLLDYIQIISKNKWMIVLITVIVVFSTVVWSLVQPRVYQASMSIVPSFSLQQENLISLSGSIESTFFLDELDQGYPFNIYEDILKSRSLSDALVDRFDLVKNYEHVKSKGSARIRLKNSTNIKTSRHNPIIHIIVNDYDPNRAEALCKGYVEEIHQKNKTMFGRQVKNKRLFLEARLKEIQDELSKNEYLQSRDAQLKEMLLRSLSRECEIAKIQEVKVMPTIQILDEALVSESPLGRGTVRKGVLACFTTIMLGVSIAFGRELHNYRSYN